MKKAIALWIITSLILFSGCVSSAGNDGTAPGTVSVEDVPWDAVSITPEDYGLLMDISDPNFDWDFGAYPLDKLVAFYLYTDGAGAEGSGDELYRRFMEAPHTVLRYMALMGRQVARGGKTGEETAAAELCRAIAFMDVVWYGGTEQFSTILEECGALYPSGDVSQLLTALQAEYDAAVGRNTQ